MKLYIDGPVNKYYVQTLCMIFFPGTKFSADEEVTEDTPQLWITMTKDTDGVDTAAKFSYKGQIAEETRHYDYREGYTKERIEKIAVGDAVTTVCERVMGYRSSWGMLTGVRPSKVATELLQKGMSKTRVKKELTKDYFVIPKKAALATDVALNEARLIGTPGRKDCSVYVSIPFCPTRCSYCSFVSYTSKRLLSLIPDYLLRLEEDLRGMFACIDRLGLNLRTIYIGGGTPTILDTDQLRRLLSTIASLTDVTRLEEYTLEAGRPDTITADKLAVAKEYGVGRISVNPQTLCDDVLCKIGRAHDTEMFYKAYEIARASGIPVINTDLIAGLPGDNFKTFSASFDGILNLRPENITVHTFCVKKSSELRQSGSDVYSMRGGDTGKCVDYSQIQCIHNGYLPYYMYRQKNTVGNFENVGFSLPGCEGLYNIYMMEEVHSIFAAGAGAVTKLVDYTPVDGSPRFIERMFNPKYPYEYLDTVGADAMTHKINRIEEFYQTRRLLEE
ncbi:MAG: coproporphyrinogen dehydrogenase HemZ [Ruminococcaceae bacterium]|nr:coproporphyrinogen dehydrogenase HemZ [Oscillospiraceae bacterium]